MKLLSANFLWDILTQVIIPEMSQGQRMGAVGCDSNPEAPVVEWAYNPECDCLFILSYDEVPAQGTTPTPNERIELTQFSRFMGAAALPQGAQSLSMMDTPKETGFVGFRPPG